MKTCSKCVLDERFPGIRFNADGQCNYCTSAKGAEQHLATKQQLDSRFRQLLCEHRGKAGYDCVVAYSGGKDSTYTLHLLQKEYGLKLLAFSFDNWFQSETAKQNIRAVLSNINVDHLTVTPSFETIKGIILASISSDIHSKKALTRASSICTSCISLIRFIGFRIAVEQGVPFLIFGMSPGQASPATAVVKTNARLIRTTQDGFLNLLPQQVREMVKPLFMDDKHFQNPQLFPYSVNPLAFTDYDEQRILRIVAGYGWKKPCDTDANSTNCLLNSLANQVHIDKFGFNPYACEIAQMVRTGDMTRQQGLERLSQPLPTEQIIQVKKILGIRD